MKFKKIDVLISENLTKEQLKDKILPQLNLLSAEQDKTGSSIYYIANIHDVNKGKYWICVDSETKETLGLPDELIDLQSIQTHTTENPDNVAKDILYSSEYIEENFLRKIIFEDYKTANDQRITDLEQLVQTNEEDIEKKNRETNVALNVLDQEVKANKSEYDEKISELDQFVQDTNTNITGLNDVLSTKAEKAGTASQTFHVADATDVTHAVSLRQLQAASDASNSSINEFKDEYQEHINQVDSNIAQLFDTFGGLETEIDEKANSSDVYSREEINNDIAGLSMAPIGDVTGNGSVTINSADQLDTIYNDLFRNNRIRNCVINEYGTLTLYIGANLILDDSQTNKFLALCGFFSQSTKIIPKPELGFKPKITFNPTETKAGAQSPILTIQNIDIEINFTGSFKTFMFRAQTAQFVNVNFTFNQENTDSRDLALFTPSYNIAYFQDCGFKLNITNPPASNSGIIFAAGPTGKISLLFYGGLNINSDTPNLKVFLAQSAGPMINNLHFSGQTAANSNLDFTRILRPITAANINVNAYNKIRFNSLSDAILITGQGSYYPTGDITQQTV